MSDRKPRLFNLKLAQIMHYVDLLMLCLYSLCRLAEDFLALCGLLVDHSLGAAQTLHVQAFLTFHPLYNQMISQLFLHFMF